MTNDVNPSRQDRFGQELASTNCNASQSGSIGDLVLAFGNLFDHAIALPRS